VFGIKRKYNVLKSGIIKGKTDIHCHVLPGVDDGSPDMTSSLRLLDFMENELGYSEVWLTPHTMHDLHNTAEKLQGVFRELLSSYSGGICLHLSSEYMMDEGFSERLNTDPLRLGNEHLLVETSYMNPPAGLHDILLSVWNKGFRPLIAHPERYMYMGEHEYRFLKESGYDFQLNLMSLSGYYGSRAKHVGEHLLEEGFYDFVGTDLHHLEHYKPTLERLKLKKDQLEMLEELFDNNAYI